MNMSLLIVGSKGQLGWELCRRGNEKGFDIAALDVPEFDMTDPSMVDKAVSHGKVSLVVNAAAYTAVDKAETEPEPAFAVNRDGPAHLSARCAEFGIPLIHISTDYVFDGKKQGPYLVTDPISPLGVYGRSKAEGEAKVREHLPEHIILRTAWLYGVHGQNFVKTMLRLGRENEVLRVVADQYGCPTYAADLAEAVVRIAGRIGGSNPIAWGTYHYCGKGATTWHGFAEKIFDLAGKHDSLMVKKVEPLSTAEYPTPAQRPPNSVLDCTLITAQFGIKPQPWQESLSDMINIYYQHEYNRNQ